MQSKARSTLQIGNISLTVSNLDKPLYPTGFTKGEVIDYYIRIAPVLLPHLRNHPVTLKRYPNGSMGQFFYQKQCPVHRPDWFTTVPVWSEGKQRHIYFCLIDSLPALVWAANLASLEFHPSLSVAETISRPSTLVFDLDPGPPATLVECAQVAIWLQQIMDQYGLKLFPKTSGSKGLQLYLPVNSPVGYGQTKGFARQVARLLEKKYPDHVTATMTKKLRQGKVFIDWSQNDEHKTTVCVYSLRAREKPTVSTPVTWDELQTLLQTNNPQLLDFDSSTVLQRVERYGDLFAPLLTLQQTLPQ